MPKYPMSAQMFERNPNYFTSKYMYGYPTCQNGLYSYCESTATVYPNLQLLYKQIYSYCIPKTV